MKPGVGRRGLFFFLLGGGAVREQVRNPPIFAGFLFHRKLSGNQFFKKSLYRHFSKLIKQMYLTSYEHTRNQNNKPGLIHPGNPTRSAPEGP